MNTPDNLELAREWAEGDFDQAYIHAGPRAAAEVIAALPDEWIDADKLRETIEFHRDRLPHGAEEDLESLLPAPDPRKTLADMTPEEREACQWMQADFSDSSTGRTIRVVITRISPITADIILLSGTASCTYHGRLTPLPDLPRMVWPGKQAAEETPDQPRPEDVKPDPQPGEAWLIEYEGGYYDAVYWYSEIYAHWSFVEGREGLKTVESPEATPVSRLVPEVKA